MHLLRDLPISRKLGLSALAALILLGSMYWSARTDLATVAAEQHRAAQAAGAERRIADVLLVGAHMQAIGRQVPTMQELPRLAAALREVGTETAHAHAILQGVRHGGVDATAASDLAAAGSTLDRFAAVLRQAGAMRHKIVRDRGRNLIQAWPTFQFSLTSFATELANGGMVASGVEGVAAGLSGTGTAASVAPGGPPGAAGAGVSEAGASEAGVSGAGGAHASAADSAAARAPGAHAAPPTAAEVAATAAKAKAAAAIATAIHRFNAYRLAMARMQNAALLFLATGNRGAANAVDDGVNASNKAMKSLLASGIPASTQSDAKTVGMLGIGISRAAQAAVKQSIVLDHFVAGPVTMMDRSMQTSLTAASGELARQARVATLAATRAQFAAQRRLA
ncbi:MAG: hypothetical protein ACREFY_09710, partial [Acetobacteraceae bacterium]